ncbi:MAG: hypothetical protein ACT4O1_16315 [Gemmatimonadota bacterium]
MANAQVAMSVQNSGGMQLVVAPQHAEPALRVILPGRPVSDTSISILFPEHVSAVERGSTAARQLYMFRPGRVADPPAWRGTMNYVEYDRELAAGLHLRARATLEDDGIRFRYEFTNRSSVAYAMIYAVTDPRLTGAFHDPRLERTFVHHTEGFDLLASETPVRLEMPIEEWLPARYLASFTWPVPTELTARRDGIMYYNKSRRVDEPFIATISTDRAWVIASFAREPGNVWSNPALTCQHVDPQISLNAGAAGVIEVKLLVLKGSVGDAFRLAREQRLQLAER